MRTSESRSPPPMTALWVFRVDSCQRPQRVLHFRGANVETRPMTSFPCIPRRVLPARPDPDTSRIAGVRQRTSISCGTHCFVGIYSRVPSRGSSRQFGGIDTCFGTLIDRGDRIAKCSNPEVGMHCSLTMKT